MATKNGRSPETEAAEAPREVRYTINGRSYAMRLQHELTYGEQLKFGKANNKLTSLKGYFELDDDSDDDVPEEVEATYAQALMRIARIAFPGVPAGAWHQLAPMEITTLANAFIAEMNREPEGNVRPVGTTPTGSLTASPASNGSTEPLTLVSGSDSIRSSATA